MQRLLRLLDEARCAVAFTGAGISTESGLPDFRSPSGMWRRHDPFVVATAQVLHDDPHTFFSFYRDRLDGMGQAEPNRGHLALAELERQQRIRAVITQNIDGLHQRAGSSTVIELHGTLSQASCTRCEQRLDIEVLRRALSDPHVKVPHCGCGGVLRPAVVLFGEGLPEAQFSQAVQLARACDLMLVVGSSLTVYPAAGLPALARRQGAALAIINAEPTPLDDMASVVIRQPAGEVLAELAYRGGECGG